MFQATTHNIRIEVQPAYLSEQSNPAQNYFYFSYRVRIVNEGSRRVQLLSRHWIITDAYGKVEEVTGAGVVGKQPTLKPGESFEYSSFCPLATPTGSMTGTYLMIDAQGEQLEVEIPKFILTEPNHYH
ncbi:MAG: Co2+/Mg2+ efflux protein ApaG [Bdellovibrionales bacterium]|nr:Co2+/Mg2+ efflux protein ApaG [Bdellovibrionales bacterium]